MISGSLPFMDGDLETLIEAIHNTPPDLQQMGVFAPILSTLLSKDPHERYGNARLVMAELGKLLPESPPMETNAIRESLLQAAQFVGRDTELDQLERVMKEAATGNGSVWLIGGESGVGKSRLLDELQICALIDGVLVVRGQSISEGGSPYQMWRGILRWLGLLTDLSDFEASTFKVFVPEIELLLNRPVANLAETDVQMLQSRLMVAVNQVLQRQQHPIAILLEDIHWAGDESMALLARLSAAISQRPILILATYRDDERPDLPKLLNKTQVLPLKRLNQEGISEFAAGVLGLSKLGNALPKLLYRETEGNLFFLVEVMRALTEEAGQIDAISTMDIPEHIITGGIQRFVQRRLHRVVPEYQPLLKLAAVMGRQFDLKVLAYLQPDANLQAWLDHCTNMAVLELRENTWGFSHDKLRNGLLLELPSSERRELHHKVALTLEALYADLPEYASALAYQWGEAGETLKQIHYLIKAGEEARRTGANTTAAEMLDKAAQLATTSHLPVIERVRMERLRGDTYLALGKLGESVTHMKEALNLLGHHPPSNRRLLAATMKEFFIQIGHRLQSNPRPVEQERADELIQVAEVYQHLTLYYYFMGDTVPSFHANLSTLNYAEAANRVSPELATAYGSIAVAAGVVMLHKAAAFYFNKAEVVAQAVDVPRVWIGLFQRRNVYHIGRAEWAEAERDIINGKAMANSLRDERTRRELMSTEVFQLNLQGKLEQSVALASELRRSAELDQDVQNILYSASFGGAGLLRLGRYNEAIDILSEFKGLDSTVVPASERGRILNIWGILSLCHFYQAQYEQAREAVKVVVNALTIYNSPDSNYPFVFGYTARAIASKLKKVKEQAPKLKL